MRRDRLSALLLVALLGALGVGLVAFLELRFDVGDVYPPYSSLRSDPLGTRALYEALSLQPGVTLRRGYDKLPEGTAAADTTAFVIGATSVEWQLATPENLKEIEDFTFSGGHLILSFVSVRHNPHFERQLAEHRSEQRQRDEQQEPHSRRTRSLREEWGVAFRFEEAPLPAEAERTTDKPGTPSRVSWESGLWFDRLSDAWTVLYTVDDHPVVITRAFGRGSITLLSDSYAFSNEAMRRNRQTVLISELVGDRRHVVFDESHLAVTDQEGVMTLARRFRLVPALLAALAVMALFVWRASTSLLARDEGPRSGVVVVGRDSFDGLVRLLSRGIPPARLLPTALAEWEKSGGAPTDEMRTLTIARKDADIVDRYRKLCEAARSRRPGGKEPDAV